MVKWVHDSEVIRLPCKIFGSGRGTLGVSFLKDGNEISTDSTESVYIDEVSSQLLHRVLVIEARRGNEGVYQCMGQVGNDGTTTITTSTYVNIQCKLLHYNVTYVHLQWTINSSIYTMFFLSFG